MSADQSSVKPSKLFVPSILVAIGNFLLSKLRQRRKREVSGKTYASRNEILRKLGFGSYAEYLESGLWKAVKEMVFSEKGRTCVLCGSVATQVHHVRYCKEDLLGRTLKCLFPICRKCHKTVEFANGIKLKLSRAAKKTRRMKQSHERSIADQQMKLSLAVLFAKHFDRKTVHRLAFGSARIPPLLSCNSNANTNP